MLWYRVLIIIIMQIILEYHDVEIIMKFIIILLWSMKKPQLATPLYFSLVAALVTFIAIILFIYHFSKMCIPDTITRAEPNMPA